MKLDLVIPCYNPPGNWEKEFCKSYLSFLGAFYPGQENTVQLILINDGSTKNFSQKEIRYLQSHIPQIQILSYEVNRGKGFALRAGISVATSSFCVYSDYDFPFGLKAIAGIHERLKNGPDIVTGSRDRRNYQQKISLKRKIISSGLIWLNSLIFKLPVTDTQAGIKGFNENGKMIFLKTSIDRFLFDLEFIYLASETGALVIEPYLVQVEEDIKLSDFSWSSVAHECKNLFKLIVRKYGKGAEDIIQYRPGRI